MNFKNRFRFHKSLLYLVCFLKVIRLTHFSWSRKNLYKRKNNFMVNGNGGQERSAAPSCLGIFKI